MTHAQNWVFEWDLDIKSFTYGCGIYCRNSCEDFVTETYSAYCTDGQSLNAKEPYTSQAASITINVRGAPRTCSLRR